MLSRLLVRKVHTIPRFRSRKNYVHRDAIHNDSFLAGHISGIFMTCTTLFLASLIFDKCE